MTHPGKPASEDMYRSMTLGSRIRELFERLRSLLMIIALLLCFASGATLIPANTFNGVSQELVSLLSLIIAGVLPAAVLSATILRAGSLSIRRITQYRDALVKQVNIWAGFFVFSLAACIFIIIGKLVDWDIHVTFNAARGDVHKINIAHALNGGIFICLFVLLFRAIEIFKGIRSLVLLSAEIAISEARSRERAELKRSEDDLEGMPARADSVQMTRIG